MLYSIRMRSAQGGAHEHGGHHISGAERLITKQDLPQITENLIKRALNHEKGRADFIRLTIEEVKSKDIITIPMLKMETYTAMDVNDGHKNAREFLANAGISKIAIENAMIYLLSLQENMRGAILIDATTGKRLDDTGMRGIRVSRMDFKDTLQAKKHFDELGYTDNHVQEALVLASKVLSAPNVIGELCWSDDPNYIIGYVSANNAYHRITKMKPLHSNQGGRVFFVKTPVDINSLQNYLERQPVIVDINL